MTLSQALRFIDLRARMALRADASTMYLGYVWWVLEPLLFVAIFYLVFGIILESGRADFLMFLIVGKLPFQWFSGGVNSSANSIVGAKAVISQVNIPKALLPLSKVQESTYRQMAVFSLMFFLLISDGYRPSFHWLWVIPLFLVQYLVIGFLAMICASLVCAARDFAKVIQLFVVGMMFASGIFWDVRSLDPVVQSMVLTYNPIALLIDSYRQVLMFDRVPDVARLLNLTLITGALAAVAFLLMRRANSWLTLRAIG